ncbi:Uncharacterised protein [Cedecea lapagei]|uniref:Uncharacterized protein n=1 Tax=Cedecea lapagei TaxID=158823 RepID=A0A447V5W3_9ENTR|nr:Uncharacterised protein [Cedecea lapagei]
MAKEKKTEVKEEVSDKAAVVKFCPICGSVMEEKLWHGIMCWVCPECDFVIPVQS